MPAREIKTTLAVDGEQAYKRAINDAKTSVRNLGTQLSLAQAEFKKSGDAQKLMETRAKALKNEIDQQNEIVKSLDGALKDAVKQYGEGSKEAEKWQAELNRAKATMASLEAELSNNERGLDRNGKAFDDASTAANDFNDAVRSVGKGVSFELITSGISKITSGFESAIKKAGELALSMWNMMRDAAEWGDEELRLADVYGVSVEELQQMQHAAKMVNTDLDTVIKSRKKLAEAMHTKLEDDAKQEAANSKKKKDQELKEDTDMQETWKALRVPVYDNEAQKFRDLETVFWEAGAAIMKLDDGVLQNHYAMKLFGKSWDELKPMFLAGSKAFQEAMDAAPVVSKEKLDKLGELQSQLHELDDQFQALKINVLSELAPAFEVLAKSLTDLMSEFNAYLQTDEGKELMKSLQDAITAFFSEISKTDLKTAVNSVSDGLNLVKDGFNWIKDNKDSIINALKGIGIAFAGLKLVEVAANMGKIAWGFKQLFGGGGNGNTGTTPTTTGGGSTPTTIPTTVPRTHWYTAPLNGATKVLNDSMLLTGIGSVAPVVADRWLNETNSGRAVRDGGDFIKGVEQDFKEVTDDIKKNSETFLTKDNALFRPFIEQGENNILFWNEFWQGFGEKWKLAQEAEEWNLGDHVTAEEAADFVNNGGQVVVKPEEAIIQPDDNWVFGDDASIEDIMNWMNNSGKLTQGIDSGVNAGVYAGVAGATTGEQITSQDIAAFNKVPDQMSSAVAKAVGGIRVQMDRTTVGYLVAPIVSNIIASQVG